MSGWESILMIMTIIISISDIKYKDNKDIVIGMLQSLSMKNYPASMFDSFGLTIIDEVHRIGSEQFSKTLLRVLSPKYHLILHREEDWVGYSDNFKHVFIKTEEQASR